MSTIRLVDSGAALAARGELIAVYAAVFCAPPWNEPPERAVNFGDRLAAWAGQSGFVGVLAEQSGSVTGFAVGVTTPDHLPRDHIYDHVRSILGPVAVTELCGRLEVLELAVHPSARRGGLGRRMLDALVGDRPAWLITVPVIPGTTAFYDAVGWQRCGTGHGIMLYSNVPLPETD